MIQQSSELSEVQHSLDLICMRKRLQISNRLELRQLSCALSSDLCVPIIVIIIAVELIIVTLFVVIEEFDRRPRAR